MLHQFLLRLFLQLLQELRGAADLRLASLLSSTRTFCLLRSPQLLQRLITEESCLACRGNG